MAVAFMTAPGAAPACPSPHPHVEKGQADARGPTTAALPVAYLALYIDSISSISWPFGPVGFGATFMISRLVAGLLVILAWAPAMCEELRVPSSAAEIRLSYAPVVKRVAPAVVNVYAARVVENRMPLFDDPIFRRFFGGGGLGG